MLTAATWASRSTGLRRPYRHGSLCRCRGCWRLSGLGRLLCGVSRSSCLNSTSPRVPITWEAYASAAGPALSASPRFLTWHTALSQGARSGRTVSARFWADVGPRHPEILAPRSSAATALRTAEFSQSEAIGGRLWSSESHARSSPQMFAADIAAMSGGGGATIGERAIIAWKSSLPGKADRDGRQVLPITIDLIIRHLWITICTLAPKVSGCSAAKQFRCHMRYRLWESLPTPAGNSISPAQ